MRTAMIQQGSSAVAPQATPEGATITTSAGPGGLSKTITYPDGKGGVSRIVIDRNGVQIGGDSHAGEASARDMPPGVQEITKDFFLTVAIIVIGFPLARALARWVDRRGTAAAAPSADVARRLQAIESAVETIAVEMERVSEGQRYATKLLSERAQPLAGEFAVAARDAVARERD